MRSNKCPSEIRRSHKALNVAELPEIEERPLAFERAQPRGQDVHRRAGDVREERDQHPALPGLVQVLVDRLRAVTVPHPRTENIAVDVPPLTFEQTMVFVGEPLVSHARRVQVFDHLVVPWALDGGLLRRDNARAQLPGRISIAVMLREQPWLVPWFRRFAAMIAFRRRDSHRNPPTIKSL